MNMKSIWVKSGLILMMVIMGCVSPDYSESKRVGLDDESMDGGISATDVRTVAKSMCPTILGIPEIVNANDVIRIKVANIKNSSRFFIDRNLFAKRLCLELNKYGAGSIRFIDNNSSVQDARKEVIQDRNVDKLREQIKLAAKSLVDSYLVQQASDPIKVAVIPTLNANLVNMNADSFSVMLRGEIIEQAKGKIQFLMPGETSGADYWLAGQFYPESMKKEGIINLANYIEVIDQRIKDGKGMYIPEVAMASVTPISSTAVVTGSKEDILLQMLRNPELHKNPNCDKKLNLMLVQPNDKVCVWEKTIVADRRISSNAGKANYILSGEISGMSQNSNGKVSDYLLITMELVDPETNEIIWQDAYEVKRVSKAGVVYR